MRFNLAAFLMISCLSITASAVELVRLTPDTWDEFVPQGKEVDAIYGDYVLRNDQMVAVIAEPLPTRNANMTVRNVGAMIIDLTRRESQSDQLSVYKPNGMVIVFESPKGVEINVDDEPVSAAPDLKVSGKSIDWSCSTTTSSGLEVTVRYLLKDGDDFLHATTAIENTTDEVVSLEVSDYLRADRSFTFGADKGRGLFWANDDWFRQAYGVLLPGHTFKQGGSRRSVLSIQREGSSKVSLKPDVIYAINRKVFPGSSLLEVRSIANRLSGQESFPVSMQVTDPAGPVVHAKVSVSLDGQEYGSGRTAENGKVSFALPKRAMKARIEAIGREPVESYYSWEGESARLLVELPEAGYVVGKITDKAGGPIPCKVALHGVEGTATPDFGPDSGAIAVKNLHYTHNGEFRQAIGPGKYEAIISFGPEYDAVFQTIEVRRGEEAQLNAKLLRVVDTTGWVSSDFHSHSTPSGDNTSMQLGRVLNLLCEHVEFCPCTEHNRIDSYVPHLKQLGVEHLMATCTGMELTQSLGTVNHQNAFPLLWKPRTQDGGAPVTDSNPIVQIERLALWDSSSDKLVQENHPNLVQILGDKDNDGKPDGGFEKMFGFMDVIEVHPPEGIFTAPEKDERGRLSRNPIYHWLQMLNLGYRIPGVVNTDAHYNFHETGWLRNYLKSSTDDPAKVDTMEMVHAAEAGHVIMSTGPFMEVTLKSEKPSDKPTGIPGGDVIAPSGKATLSVRVQCPNWLDVNRVQVFLNGRASKDLNFTRRETPKSFSNEVIKFESDIMLDLREDTHVIVAAIGEGQKLGRIMGPRWGEKPPIAVSNPIFVDVDGEGFKPNGDLLDVPLPLGTNSR
jgi:hypothetical protein